MTVPFNFGLPQIILLLIGLTGVALIISLIYSLIVKEVEVFELEEELEEEEEEAASGKPVRYLSKKRRKPRWNHGGIGLILLVVAISLLWVTFLTETYLGLTGEIKVAHVKATTISNVAHELSVEVILYDSNGSATSDNTYLLQGDEWMLQGDIIRFPAWLNILGLHSGYKLTRLEGRYDDIQLENTAPHTAIALNGGDDNFFKTAQAQKSWLSWFVDASYGSAVFQGAGSYDIYASQDALTAHPTP